MFTLSGHENRRTGIESRETGTTIGESRGHTDAAPLTDRVQNPRPSPEIRRPSDPTRHPKEPPDQFPEMANETVDRPEGAGESAGRPRRELIAAQERLLKDAVAEIRVDAEKLLESFENPDSTITEIDRATLQRFVDSVNFLCSYLEDKLSILLDVSTKEEDRIHIAMVVSVHLEDTFGSSDELKNDLHVDDAVIEQAEEKSATLSLIGILQGLLKRLGNDFSKLVSGLLTPKEWTLKGEFGTVVFFAKAGVSVEIKFGR